MCSWEHIYHSDRHDCREAIPGRVPAGNGKANGGRLACSGDRNPPSVCDISSLHWDAQVHRAGVTPGPSHLGGVSEPGHRK